MAALTGVELLAHGGLAGAIAEALMVLAVVGVLGAVWLRERRRTGDDEPEERTEVEHDE